VKLEAKVREGHEERVAAEIQRLPPPPAVLAPSSPNAQITGWPAPSTGEASKTHDSLMLSYRINAKEQQVVLRDVPSRHMDEAASACDVDELRKVLGGSDAKLGIPAHDPRWKKQREDSALHIAALRDKVQTDQRALEKQQQLENAAPEPAPDAVRDETEVWRAMMRGSTEANALLSKAIPPEVTEASELLTWLVQAGIPRERARVYQVQLHEEGFETIESMKLVKRADLEGYGADAAHAQAILEHAGSKELLEGVQTEEQAAASYAWYAKALLSRDAPNAPDTVARPKQSTVVASQVGASGVSISLQSNLPPQSAPIDSQSTDEPAAEDPPEINMEEIADAAANATSPHRLPPLVSQEAPASPEPVVAVWMADIGIPKDAISDYYGKFLEDGFDSMDAVKCLTAEDLNDYQLAPEHADIVVAAIAAL